MDFDNYLKQLEPIEEVFPPSAYEYARDSSHYNLSSHSSLHDAWLEYVHVKEKSSGERNEIRSTVIELCFLGPFHDRYLILTYGGVLKYRVWSNDGATGHGELATHEFKESPENNPVHELRFHGESSISIEFSEFSYREEAKANK